MKNKIVFLFMSVFMAVFLTACTQADTENNAAAGTGTSGTPTQSGTVSVGITPENAVNAEAGTGGSALSDVGSAGAAAEGTVSADPAPEQLPENSAGGTEAVLDEANYSDEEFDALDNEDGPDEGWSGTYVSETGEKLTVSVDEAENISFSFETAGISGLAELDGNQAVYHGDDYHVVVFVRDQASIEVSVLSEEDYDTSQSPLIGVYAKE